MKYLVNIIIFNLLLSASSTALCYDMHASTITPEWVIASISNTKAFIGMDEFGKPNFKEVYQFDLIVNRSGNKPIGVEFHLIDDWKEPTNESIADLFIPISSKEIAGHRTISFILPELLAKSTILVITESYLHKQPNNYHIYLNELMKQNGY